MNRFIELPLQNGTRLAARVQSNQQGGPDANGSPFGLPSAGSNYNNFNVLNPSVGKKPLPHNGYISSEDIEELKCALPVVLEHYGVISNNRNFKSLWRDDSNPSCSVIPGTYLVHDFGTGETVDVYGLVGIVEDIDYFPDQVRRVADIVGHELKAVDMMNLAPKMAVKRPRFMVPPVAGFEEESLLPYASLMADLLENKQALAYLQSRGITEEKAYQNVIGYVDDPKKLSCRFTLSEPVATCGYIVFPFPVDETFATVNYTMVQAIPKVSAPKFKSMRPKGVISPLYREWLLYRRCKVLYVAEGLIDCLSIELLYHRPCIGLGGTSGVKRLASLLYYMQPQLRPMMIILALDADEAGKRASKALLADLDAMGIPCSAMPMAEGCKDPNDMLVMVGGAL